MPQCDGVAFDDLADAVADRFEQVVARGQPVGIGGEAAMTGRQRHRVVQVHQFVRHPNVAIANEIAAFDPQELGKWREPGVRKPEYPGDIDQGMGVAEILDAAEPERQRDMLRMIGFDRFHDPGRLGRVEIAPLALGHRDRSRVRPAHHHDGNSDRVEAGHIGDAGDPHDRQEPPHAGDGVPGRDHAMGAVPKSLLRAGAAAVDPTVFGGHRAN